MSADYNTCKVILSLTKSLNRIQLFKLLTHHDFKLWGKKPFLVDASVNISKTSGEFTVEMFDPCNDYVDFKTVQIALSQQKQID